LLINTIAKKCKKYLKFTAFFWFLNKIFFVVLGAKILKKLLMA